MPWTPRSTRYLWLLLLCNNAYKKYLLGKKNACSAKKSAEPLLLPKPDQTYPH